MKPGKMKVSEKSLYVKTDFSDWSKSQHSGNLTLVILVDQLGY